jgi:hypothetical protein
MEKYAKILNEETKSCIVGTGSDSDFYKSIGMALMNVEQAYNGSWYLSGYAPLPPEPTYQEKRAAEYPEIGEQLDMIYWDKINNTSTWLNKITEIKEKYPKPIKA